MGYYGADDQGNPPSFDFGTGNMGGGGGYPSYPAQYQFAPQVMHYKKFDPQGGYGSQGNPLSSLFDAIRQGAARRQNWGGMPGQGRPEGQGGWPGRPQGGDPYGRDQNNYRRQPGQGYENQGGVGRQTGGWPRGPWQTTYGGAPQGQSYVPYNPLGQQSTGPAANPQAQYSPNGSLPQGGAISAAQPAGPVYNPSQRLPRL